MNHEPFAPELLDELCSADLDGELEGACAEHGIAVEDARAAIEANGVRRDALASAGAFVGELTAADHVDELERRRLSHLAAARSGGRGATRDRRARLLVALGSVAAAALIAVVVIALARHGGNRSNTASRSSATQPASASASSVNTVALGNISDGRDLAGKLGLTTPNGAVPDQRRVAAGQDTPGVYSQSNGKAAAIRGHATAAPSAKAAPLPGSSASASDTADATTTHCLATLPDADRASGVAVIASARLHGVPVTIARGSLHGTVALWAFRPADCGVVLFYTGS